MHALALGAQGLRLFPLPKRIVEYDDMGPADFSLPILDLGHKTVSDIALFWVGDEVLNSVAFFRHLPGDIADQP
jgi:hypothetical protein